VIYFGKNHSDSTLVMRLPKEKIIFTVDWIALQTLPYRGMADTYLPDIEEGLNNVIAMEWDRLRSPAAGLTAGLLPNKHSPQAGLGGDRDETVACRCRGRLDDIGCHGKGGQARPHF
jgi:hypothetical protein